MKILALSDTHGNLPKVPECDLLLVVGDVCPLINHDPVYQLNWLDGRFRRWLASIPAQHIVGIAGNHDFIFEHPEVGDLDLPWTYLQDSSVTIGGTKIYGIPWVPSLPNWAFHMNKEGLALRYDAIPSDVDIVLSHGPPYGYGDQSAVTQIRCGSRSAANMLRRVKPKVLVCGHVHEGFGYYRHGPTDIYNVSYVDEHYAVRRRFADTLIEIDLSDDVKGDAPEEQTDPERQVRNSITNA